MKPELKIQATLLLQLKNYIVWIRDNIAQFMQYCALLRDMNFNDDVVQLRKLVAQLGVDLEISPADQKTLLHRSLYEGLSFMTKTMPTLAKALDQGLSTGVFKLPTNFKSKWRDSEIPAFCGSLFLRVFDRRGNIRINASTDAVKRLRQFLYFAYKAKYEYSDKDVDAVLSTFVSTERSVKSIEYDPNDPILKMANMVVTQVLGQYDRRTLQFKHGPGITANVRIQEKYEHRLTPGLPIYRQFADYFWFNPEDGITRLERYPVYNTSSYFQRNVGAKVILVPKDSRGPRLISCEPCENQYIQQGLMKFMVETMESSSITGGQVNFTDQSINQRLAKEGSIDQSWATLDLKEASDRNPLKLTEHLFGGVPTLLSDLLHSRSGTTTLPDGTVVELSKFAPMGSACCFPVMALSIYALLFSAFIGLGQSYEQARSSIYVYGDDIIVPNDYAEYAMDVLERYGFLVNRNKSFHDSRFLESCGADAFDGVLVTPVRLRVPVRGSLNRRGHPTELVSLVSTMNQLRSIGCMRAADHILRFVERRMGVLPYGTVNSPYICKIVDDGETAVRFNLADDRLRWSREDDLNLHPLGRSLRAWRLTPSPERFQESPYGRFSRTHKLLGKEMKLPIYGHMDVPRSTRLHMARNTHYDMHGIPSIL